MVARGSIGNAFLFKQIKEFEKDKKIIKRSDKEILGEGKRLLELAEEFSLGVNSVRGYFIGLASGFFGAKKLRDSFARAKEIDEIKNAHESGRVEYNVVFDRDPVKDKFIFNGNSQIIKKISIRSGKSEEAILDEVARRSALLQVIADRGIVDFRDFNVIIHNFYKDSEEVYEQFGITGSK